MRNQMVAQAPTQANLLISLSLHCESSIYFDLFPINIAESVCANRIPRQRALVLLN
jgi:hypothetical protein